MAKVTFNTDLCKGCGLCVRRVPQSTSWPSHRDQINKKGYHPAEMTDPEASASAAPSAPPCAPTASSRWR